MGRAKKLEQKKKKAAKQERNQEAAAVKVDELRDLDRRVGFLKEQKTQIENKLDIYGRKKKNAELVANAVANFPEDTKFYKTIGRPMLNLRLYRNSWKQFCLETPSFINT